MERKRAHRLLFERLAVTARPRNFEEMEARVEHHLGLSAEEKETRAEALFSSLAAFAADALSRKVSN
jgi:hypothetical protein